MILSATALTHFQDCRRRHLIELDWYAHHHRPKTLFDRLLSRAIYKLSNGGDPVAEADEARTQFLEAAANPGLDQPYGTNTYQVAKDWCAMLETIPRAVATLVLLTVKPAGVVFLDDLTSWQTTSWMDDSGTLHRWITVDKWNEDALAREMHGWHAFGDMAVLRAPMMLHVIEIGQMRKGRRASQWARGWRHPSVANIHGVHFKHKDGSSYQKWTPLYLADAGDITPEDWVEAMIRDRVIDDVVHHVTVNAPSDAVCEDTVRQMLAEARRMRAMEREGYDWTEIPMSRGACDGLVPCIWQDACYAVGASKVVDLITIGLYTRKENVVEGVKV
jgi:hypothetical protein